MSQGATFASAAVLAIAAVATEELQACAACRNPSLPTARASEGPLGEDTLRLAALLSGTWIHIVHEAGCRDRGDCDEVPSQPLHLHDQEVMPLELRLQAEYGFTPVLGLEAHVPFRTVIARVDYTTPDGEPYQPLDEGTHHRNETLAGLTDPWLLARVTRSFGTTRITGRLGLSFPLGHTEEDPFALGDLGLRHQHIQFGSGTFDPVVIADLEQPLSEAYRLRFFAQLQASLYENSHGYRAPFRLQSGAAFGFDVVGRLSAEIGAELAHESAERWQGVIKEDGSLGRTELAAALTVSQAIDQTQLLLMVRVPVLREIRSGSEAPLEFESPLILTVGATHTLGE